MKSKTPSARTPTQRKQDERDRHREAGRIGVQIWVHPKDRDRVIRYVQRVNKERFGDS